ncbi:hypothetical protein L9F63_009237, partial [Diploptera punctata]
MLFDIMGGECDRKRRSLLRKFYPNTILLTQKSIHTRIIVEIRKLPDETKITEVVLSLRILETNMRIGLQNGITGCSQHTVVNKWGKIDAVYKEKIVVEHRQLSLVHVEIIFSQVVRSSLVRCKLGAGNGGGQTILEKRALDWSPQTTSTCCSVVDRPHHGQASPERATVHPRSTSSSSRVSTLDRLSSVSCSRWCSLVGQASNHGTPLVLSESILFKHIFLTQKSIHATKITEVVLSLRIL